MNKIDYSMFFMSFVLLSVSIYLGYHNYTTTARWKSYAITQGCEYLGRSPDNYHQILIECNAVIHSERGKTYGLPQ